MALKSARQIEAWVSYAVLYTKKNPVGASSVQQFSREVLRLGFGQPLLVIDPVDSLGAQEPRVGDLVYVQVDKPRCGRTQLVGTVDRTPNPLAQRWP